ncbi:MAG: hypothetical protein IT335_00370 [Thermomicrobiales bacterium]|nr:hypothetical protein [Thermomicrobiales bacterium]
MILTQSTFDTIEEVRMLLLGWLRAALGLELAPDDSSSARLKQRRSR